jgi:hypothetical protein
MHYKGELGEADLADIEAILAERASAPQGGRDVVSCEPELTTETIDLLRVKLQAVKH